MCIRDSSYPAAAFDYVGASPPPTTVDAAGGKLEWANLGPLTANQEQVVTVRLKAKTPGVGWRNCAKTSYQAAGLLQEPEACATVDVYSTGPALGVDKVLAQPLGAGQVAVGDQVPFTITLRNLGAVTVTNVGVLDTFSPSCFAFVDAPGMSTGFPGPGKLLWTFAALGGEGAQQWAVPWGLELNSTAYNKRILDGLGIKLAKNLPELVEQGPAARVFAQPAQARTQAYLAGEIG